MLGADKKGFQSACVCENCLFNTSSAPLGATENSPARPSALGAEGKCRVRLTSRSSPGFAGTAERSQARQTLSWLASGCMAHTLVLLAFKRGSLRVAAPASPAPSNPLRYEENFAGSNVDIPFDAPVLPLTFGFRY